MSEESTAQGTGGVSLGSVNYLELEANGQITMVINGYDWRWTLWDKERLANTPLGKAFLDTALAGIAVPDTLLTQVTKYHFDGQADGHTRVEIENIVLRCR
ncbi:hypothetical protein CAL14_08620 [Bordetella genomosp. 9]|nr:hypothetical protein CAL14_08620 [Bordetella genomosp. 9]